MSMAKECEVKPNVVAGRIYRGPKKEFVRVVGLLGKQSVAFEAVRVKISYALNHFGFPTVRTRRLQNDRVLQQMPRDRFVREFRPATRKDCVYE